MSSCRALPAVMLVAVSLGAATLERLSMDDLILKSTGIVRARVVGSWAAYRGPVIYTHFRVQVQERWKGPANSELDVVVPGGTVGNLRQSFSGAPALVTGNEYVLFLWTGRTGLTHVIGLTQGVFELTNSQSGEKLAVRPASTETTLDSRTGRVVNDQGVEFRLEELARRIRTTLASAERR